MARLLLAWERGGGDGHAVTLAQLATLLLGRGHEVHLVWRDLAPVARLLGADPGWPRLHCWQAPLAAARHDDLEAPVSYAELLLRAGFGDADGLLMRVLAWRELLAAIAPDGLLADYAPTALLAARDGGMPLVHIGSSFQLPPLRSPFPPFNDWQPLDPERPVAAEERALEHANLVLTRTGRRPLAGLRQLLQVDASFRLGFDELDHYAGQREPDEAPACGWPETPSHGDEPVWPDGPGPRLFGYLPRSHPAVPVVIERLRNRTGPSLLCLTGASDTEVQAAGAARLRVVNRPVRMDRALEQAALVIGHAGAGSTHLALQAGRPMLLLPMQAEQLLLGRRVAAAGAGIFMWPEEVAASFDSALAALLGSPGFSAAAQRLAERNRAPAAPPLLVRIAERCEALVSARAGRRP